MYKVLKYYQVIAPLFAVQYCKTAMQAAQDYRIDPYLHEACQADVEAHCKGTKSEKGQVQSCLVCILHLCLSAGC